MKPRENPVTAETIDTGQVFDLAGARLVSVTGKGQHIKDRIRKADRARRKAFIQPQNARCIAGLCPQEDGEILYGLIPGDFQYGEFLPVIAEQFAARELYVSTLSMGAANVRMLANMRADVERMLVLVSSYWQYTDKQGVQRQLLQASLDHDFIVRHLRIHSKIVVFWTPETSVVLSGSANLRSSDSIEQFSLIRSRELGDTLKATMIDLAERKGAPINVKTKTNASDL